MVSSEGGDASAILTPTMRRRLQDREEWCAYWKLRELDAAGKIFPTIKLWVQRTIVDRPVTYMRENIVEPLQDRFRKPYYHRRMLRVPDIDQCGVLDGVHLFVRFSHISINKFRRVNTKQTSNIAMISLSTRTF